MTTDIATANLPALAAPASALTFDIGVDCDGVVHNFVSGLGDHVARATGRPRAEFTPATVWGFYVQWKLTLEEFLRHYSEGVLAGTVLWTGDPYPYAIEGLTRLHDAGHRLHVITDRSPKGAVDEAHAATHSWLQEQGVPHDTVTFSADKTVIREMAVSERILFVEDRAENFEALLDDGIDAYLIDQAWNRHVRTDRRVANLVEFADVVEDFARAA